MELVLLTPTCDRPEAFALCERWMARQRNAPPFRWIVADDGQVPAPVTMGQVHLRHKGTTPGGPPSAAYNMGRACRRAEADGADGYIVIEDDDWYGADYVHTMARLLEQCPLVGEGDAIYFNIQTRTWVRHRNTGHASMCQTGWRAEVMPTVLDILGRIDPSQSREDIKLWGRWSGAKIVIPGGSHPLAVGMKGLPGKKEFGVGHRPGAHWNKDFDLMQLREWIGADADVYRDIIPENPKLRGGMTVGA